MNHKISFAPAGSKDSSPKVPRTPLEDAFGIGGIFRTFVKISVL